MNPRPQLDGPHLRLLFVRTASATRFALRGIAGMFFVANSNLGIISFGCTGHLGDGLSGFRPSGSG